MAAAGSIARVVGLVGATVAFAGLGPAACRSAPANWTCGTPGEGTASGGRGAVTSNILRGDYAGSQACASCHARIYQAWRASPMHEMTRLPEQARVRAPFDGAEFRFKHDRARLETDATGARIMRVVSAELGDHSYRITKVIGGRYREDFAGVELPAGAVEMILPVS